MQRLALFDLDNTLVNRSSAFRTWAQEFVITHRLDAAALTWLLETDARTSGTKGPFFRAVREAFCLDQAADELWQQYRRRMPELVTCRTQDLEALRLLRAAGSADRRATPRPGQPPGCGSRRPDTGDRRSPGDHG